MNNIVINHNVYVFVRCTTRQGVLQSSSTDSNVWIRAQVSLHCRRVKLCVSHTNVRRDGPSRCWPQIYYRSFYFFRKKKRKNQKKERKRDGETDRERRNYDRARDGEENTAKLWSASSAVNTTTNALSPGDPVKVVVYISSCGCIINTLRGCVLCTSCVSCYCFVDLHKNKTVHPRWILNARSKSKGHICLTESCSSCSEIKK